MTAPTREERREVAWRLRTEVSEGECIEFAVFRIAHDVLGVEDAMGARAGRILADLVDPTCEVDSVEPVEDELGQTVGHEFHLTCGHSVKRPYIEAPAYCPECGARVVDDD